MYLFKVEHQVHFGLYIYYTIKNNLPERITLKSGCNFWPSNKINM